jgi:hypothetical protein
MIESLEERFEGQLIETRTLASDGMVREEGRQPPVLVYLEGTSSILTGKIMGNKLCPKIILEGTRLTLLQPPQNTVVQHSQPAWLQKYSPDLKDAGTGRSSISIITGYTLSPYLQVNARQIASAC